MRRILSRIKKLENRRGSQSQNRILKYNPLLNNAAEMLEKATPGKYILVPDYGSDVDWERAAMTQQSRLIKEARQP